MSTRSYLSIGDVLSLLREEFPDVTISKIRFLESQGLVDPERSPSGYRKFYDHDVDRLRWVLRQQRDQFLPLKVIRDRLAAAGNGVPADEPDERRGTPRLSSERGAANATASGNGLSVGTPSAGPSARGAMAAAGEETHAAGPWQPDEAGGNVVRMGSERRAPAGGHPAARTPAESVTGRATDEAGTAHLATSWTAGSRSAVPASGRSGGAPYASETLPAGGGEQSQFSGVGAGAPAEPPAPGGLFTDRAARDASPGHEEAHESAAPGGTVPQQGRGREPGMAGRGPDVATGLARQPTEVPPPPMASGEPGDTGARPGAAGGAKGPSIAAGSSTRTGPGTGAASGRAASPGGVVGRASAGASAAGMGSPSSVLSGSVSGVSLTPNELSAATGLSLQTLATLEGFGLLAPMAIAGDTFYDEEALTVAKLVVEFAKFGIEPRHLRLYRNAVDREVGLVEQVITPLLRQRNPEARQRAMDAASELTRLGQGLRAALVRTELRRQFGG